MASVGDGIRVGGAKGLPRSLEGLIARIDEEIAAAGSGPKAYLSARMDDQSTDKTVGDHVEYDQVLTVDASGDIALAVGAGQLGGLVTLAANKTYECMAGIRCDFTTSGGVIRVRFRDNTGAAEFGSQGEALALTGVGNAQALPIATGIIEVGGSPIVIEVRITGVANFSSFRGAGPVGNSFLKIVEIG